MPTELTAERIERAIKEISESGMYGNQVHQETMETALAALRAEQERLDPQPLTLEELWQMDGEPVYIVQIHGREEWNFRRNGGLDDCCGEWTADEDINWDRYGDLWRAYRAKPEPGKEG